MRTVARIVLAGSLFSFHSAIAGVAPVTTTVTVTSPLVVIDAGAGHQEDPHISGNLVTYTDLSGVVPATVRYHDLATGLNTHITDVLLNRFDFTSDVDHDRIVFSRTTAAGLDIFLYDIATQTSQELSPTSLDRASAEIGGNTVVWMEVEADPTLAGGLRYSVATYDLVTSDFTPLSGGPADLFPNVSPDGNVVVWLSCDVGWNQCQVKQASRDQNGWIATPLTGMGRYEGVSTDGAIVTYASIRNGDRDIYWQPVGGGPEMELVLPDNQQNPVVFDGLIVFESNHALPSYRIYAYDTITSTLFEVTQSTFLETMPDVYVLGDVATVVYTSFNGSDNDVFARSFNLNRQSSPEQQLGDLRGAIAASGNQLTKALDAKLRASENAMATGDTASACTSLQDFINHLNAQRGKKIAVADADAWIAAAQQIRLAIGCP